MVAQNKEGAPPGSSTAMLQRHGRHKGKSDHEMSGGTACSSSIYCECSLTPSGDVAHAHPACTRRCHHRHTQKISGNEFAAETSDISPPPRVPDSSWSSFPCAPRRLCCCVAMSTATGQNEGLHCCCCPTDGKVRTVYSVTQTDTLEPGLALGHLCTQKKSPTMFPSTRR